jgi:hypothetical protein
MDYPYRYGVLIGICFVLLLAVSVKVTSATVQTKRQDASVSGVFELSHTVARQSLFSTRIINSLITEADTMIGRFEVKNNTSDGFSVSITSREGGVLKPATDLDGETDIPYTIEIIRNGDTGEGVEFKTTIASSELATKAPVDILSTTSAGQQSPTDLKCEIAIQITDTDQFEMAGSYSDALAITYTDD